MDITDRLYVEIHPLTSGRTPHPHPVDDAGFDPLCVYKVLGMYNPSETSECYLVLANPKREIWFIPQRHLLAYALLDSDRFSMTFDEAAAIMASGKILFQVLIAYSLAKVISLVSIGLQTKIQSKSPEALPVILFAGTISGQNRLNNNFCRRVVMKTVDRISLLAVGALCILSGCGGGNVYKTNATDTQLSAYAGQANYPDRMQAEPAPHVFSTIGGDGTISLYNAGDEAFNGFELWVNKLYTLHVEKLDARTILPISPDNIYNKTGVNLHGVPASSINTIQIYGNGRLWDVQGPIVFH